jgi:hypothetical protein
MTPDKNLDPEFCDEVKSLIRMSSRAAISSSVGSADPPRLNSDVTSTSGFVGSGLFVDVVILTNFVSAIDVTLSAFPFLKISTIKSTPRVSSSA